MANKFLFVLFLGLSLPVFGYEVRIASLCPTNMSLGSVSVAPGAVVFDWAAARGDLVLSVGSDTWTISSNFTGRADVTVTASTLDVWERPSYISTFTSGAILVWGFALSGWLLIALARKLRFGSAGSSEL